MRIRAALVGFLVLVIAAAVFSPAGAVTPVPTARISGNGSYWAGNAMSDWAAAVKAQGATVDYTPDGSSSGPKNFALGLADFAVSEVPYGADLQDSVFPDFDYGQVPAVAGGLAFMYNLPINGALYANLRLSQAVLAKIFAGEITHWNDAAIAATNPGVPLPHQTITVVVRSDGSGPSLVLTSWMKHRYQADYAALCTVTGCDPALATSYFPYQGLSNFTAQSGSNGVTTYTANTPYTINVDEYSYALGVGGQVAQIRTNAGRWSIPDGAHVWRALHLATTHSDGAVDLDSVFDSADPNAYPLSYVASAFIATSQAGSMTTAKRDTLGYFLWYAMCAGQKSATPLGYSPLPLNLVRAGFGQVTKLHAMDPDVDLTGFDISTCDNPTFDSRTQTSIPPQMPSITVQKPTISGLPKVGSTLHSSTPSPVYRGDIASFDGPITYSYAWRADNHRIAGANRSTYAPRVTEVGKLLSVTITPHQVGFVSLGATSGHTKATVANPIAVARPVVKVLTCPTTAGSGRARVTVNPVYGSTPVTGPTTGTVTLVLGGTTIRRTIAVGFTDGVATINLPTMPRRGTWTATLTLPRSNLIKATVTSHSFAVWVGR